MDGRRRVSISLLHERSGGFFVRLIKDYWRDIADDLMNAVDVLVERVRALFARQAIR